MIDFSVLNLVDYAVVVVLVVSALFSTLRGMTREFLGILGWVISVFVAKLSAPALEPVIADIINIEGLSAALSWALPFAITVVVWFVIASLMSPGLKRAGLGSLDRWLGVVFGLARGYVIVLIAYMTAVVALDGESKLPNIVTEAYSTPYMRQSVHSLSGVIPEDMRYRLLENVPLDESPDDKELIDTEDTPLSDVSETASDKLDLLADEAEETKKTE
ncbi:MAG: CvpA family protein [Candidatus Puniceispirillum sp.]